MSASLAKSRSALEHMLSRSGSGTKTVSNQVLDFYASRDFRPVWTGRDRARARAAQVAFVLAHASRQGLESADYPVDAGRADAVPQPGRAAARYDLTLTRSLLAYAHDVRVGRVNPYAVYKDVDVPARSFRTARALAAALRHDRLNGFLRGLPPPEVGYHRLVAALARYRGIVARRGWPRVSVGSSRARLVKRLDFEDAALKRIAHPSAEQVKEAVMRFQRRHGLADDGVIGPATVKALNVPASYRVKEIAANLERWRWMPRALGARYIRVNVPDQSVEFVENDKPVLYSKVVIGTRNNATPILVSAVKAVVANPAWDIPDTISAKSIVPHLRRDPGYLAQHGMALVDGPPGDPDGVHVDWRKVRGDVLPYQIQQLPGADNGLGQIMLDMPNRFYVYLHDTPSKYLFKLSDRERSHGCVRVQKIAKLARLTLAGTVSDPKQALTKALDTGKTQRLALAKPLPIYIVYWTAWARPDGVVEFRPDLYGRDQTLIARLEGRTA